MVRLGREPSSWSGWNGKPLVAAALRVVDGGRGSEEADCLPCGAPVSNSAVMNPSLPPTRAALAGAARPGPRGRTGVIHNPSRLRRALWKIGEVGMIGVVRGVFALAARARAGPVERRRRARSRAGSARSCRSTASALANLRAAFPDKSEAEIRAILAGAWENHRPHRRRIPPSRPALRLRPLFRRHRAHRGRGHRAFIALARRRQAGPDLLGPSRQLGAAGDLRRPLRARRDRRLPPAERSGRRPRACTRSAARPWAGSRRPGRAPPSRCSGVLERGGHLGMLIDQHFTRGVTVDFLGRPAFTNPIMGKFARAFDCPVHGVRVIRLPGRPFPAELTPALDLPRDAEGARRRAGRHAGDDARRRGLGARAPGAVALDAPALAAAGSLTRSLKAT